MSSTEYDERPPEKGSFRRRSTSISFRMRVSGTASGYWMSIMCFTKRLEAIPAWSGPSNETSTGIRWGSFLEYHPSSWLRRITSFTSPMYSGSPHDGSTTILITGIEAVSIVFIDLTHGISRSTAASVWIRFARDAAGPNPAAAAARAAACAAGVVEWAARCARSALAARRFALSTTLWMTSPMTSPTASAANGSFPPTKPVTASVAAAAASGDCGYML
mmetsp:Transcript_26667/g.62514  ORF Transcript_26667/g.62514 Transcript_26667/m.62514 type:complete len:219 (-) Transcript_26667:1643-2299(-)